MDATKFFQSKKFKSALVVIAGLILVFVIFGAGVAVGLKKARFSYRWGEQYHKNFGGPRSGFFNDFDDGKDFINAHGVVGQIIKIDGQILVMKGRDNVEKIVVVNNATTINRFRETVSLADLKVEDMIVVIGEPNDSGQIQAKFIRIMPSLPSRGR